MKDMEEKNNPDIILIEEETTMNPSQPSNEENAPSKKSAKKKNRPIKDKDTIDLAAIISLFWHYKWLFLLVWVLTFVASAALIVSVPRYYTTTTRVAPEIDAGAEGSLSSIASSFGIDLGESGSTDAIYPMLYPDLMEDNGFVSKLFDIRVTSGDGKINTTYYDYLAHYQLSAPWAKYVMKLKKLIPADEPTPIKSSGKKDEFDPYVLTKKQDEVVRKIRSSVEFAYDKKTSVITINAQAQDRQICKQVADSVRVRLQKFITTYRTEKARKDVAYYEKFVNESKADYEQARRKYTSFSDANTDVELPSLQGKLEDLENDMQLKFNTYTAMNTQLQAARTKLQEKTPAFTLLQGAAVPIKPSGPKRMLFVIAMMFLTTLVTGSILLLKEKTKDED